MIWCVCVFYTTFIQNYTQANKYFLKGEIVNIIKYRFSSFKFTHIYVLIFYDVYVISNAITLIHF